MNINVLHTLGSLAINSGGPPRSVSQLCQSLSEPSTGLNVHLLTKATGSAKTVPLAPTIDHHTVSGDFAVKAKLAQIHSETPLAVIHQHSLWAYFLHEGAVFANRHEIPLVMAPRGTLKPWALAYKRWKKRVAMLLYQRRDLQRASLLHATAADEVEAIRAQGLKQPILLSPNGVELPPESELAAHEPEAQTRTVLFLSRIHPIKGLELLLHAWKRLSPQGWVLQIAGNDEIGYQAELERLCAQLSLGNTVRFSGSLFGAEKVAAYRSADLFILPSFSENFGIVIAEALGHGLPVITTTGCPWQELQTEDCGWWVSAKEEAIAAALEDAIGASAEQRRQMGLRGRELIRRKYQWEAIGMDVARAYRWLLGRGEKPDCIV